MSRAQQAIDDFYRHRRQTIVGKDIRPELQLKIVFGDPSGKAKPVDAWENLSFTISHYGAPRVLQMVVKSVQVNGQFDERIKHACCSLLEVLQGESPAGDEKKVLDKP